MKNQNLFIRKGQHYEEENFKYYDRYGTFKVTHGEQLRLVSSYDWLDLSRLKGIDEEINEFLSDEKIAVFIDDDRRKMLVHFVMARIGRLEEIVSNCR